MPRSPQKSLRSDRTHKRLRTLILKGGLPAGTPLPESRMAEELGVSRVPVREALLTLEQDGLVEFTSTGRAHVRSLKLRDFEELLAVRMALESAAARLAGAALRGDCAALRANIAETRRAKTLREVTRLDLEFHEAIVRASGNRRLSRMWMSTRNELVLWLTNLHRDHSGRSLDTRGVTADSHEKLLASILTRPPEEAARRAEEHVAGWSEWLPGAKGVMRWASALLIALRVLTAPGEALAGDGEAFFESRIRPVLADRCYECHSGEKTKGGLALDTREGLLKGGDNGPAVVPGKPEASPLVSAVRHLDPDFAMPPKKKGGKLPDAVIDDIVAWVKMGAPDPRTAVAKIAGMNAEEARNWWAFRPLPAADPSGSVDDFIEAKLAGSGIKAAERADARTLARRLSYGLTGLAPTPDQVEALRRDHSVTAVDAFIESLLSSPQYGAHWGRRWLDLARYADTAGENTDRPLTHGWRYRNWVFDAFNRDLRYDDFVRAQIAGDLIFTGAPAPARAEGIVATGYLAVARRFGHDIEKDMHLTHEDVIDTLGKNFLGLTLGCARCHDHKYDPVTARDYYALYGIFSSTRFAFPGCEPKGQPRDMVPLIAQAESDALMKPWQERVAHLAEEQKRREAVARIQAEKVARLGATERRKLAGAGVAEGKSVAFETKVKVRKGETLQLTVSPNASHGADTTRVVWRIKECGGAARVWSVAELVPDLLQGNPRAAHDDAKWCFYQDGEAPAFLTERSAALDGNSALKKWSLGDTPSVVVNASDQQVMAWTTLAAESFFMHPGHQRPVTVAWISPLDGELAVEGLIEDAHPGSSDGVAFELLHVASPDYGPALIGLGESLRPTEEPPPMPAVPLAYAVVDAKAQNARLQLRGDPDKPGEEVPRRWLSILGGEPVSSPSDSGRKELGEWIVRSPLAARVMVNRIWEWHFGRGLVSSSNDFGARGERPTHPELLDWLAAKFIESNYSVKAMHRLILRSKTYQRSCGAAAGVDPENRLLSRFTRRRLTAEEMRDSLLQASGKLDLSPAEAHPFPPEAGWRFSQHDPFSAVYETDRRSAYLMVQRQRRHPFLSLFDGADPNATTAARQTTNVATQALYFINDPFFHAQAEAFAGRLAGLPDDEARITEAWRVLFQRRPSESERTRARDFLKAYPSDVSSKWAAQTRVLMSSNEFLHVD